MKRMYAWVLAAILTVCGASVFTACSSNDDNPTPQPSDIWDAETGTLYVNSNPDKNAYKGRTDIVSVVFSDAVTGIGDSAFYDCHFGVIDIPASVRSIGSEAFAAEDSELQTVTIYAKECSFGNHPFPQSIMTDIYLPAEFEASYKAQNQYYATEKGYPRSTTDRQYDCLEPCPL